MVVVVRGSPPESFSLVSDVLMVVEEVLEALLSVLDGAEEEERDEAEVLPKGEADPPLEDSEEAAPKIEVLFVELPPKTEDEVVGTLEVAKEKLVADDALMEEEGGAASFPSPAPGTAGDPPKIEVPGEGFTWLSIDIWSRSFFHIWLNLWSRCCRLCSNLWLHGLWVDRWKHFWWNGSGISRLWVCCSSPLSPSSTSIQLLEMII